MLLAACVLPVGCTGRAQVYSVPLVRTDLPPPEPLLQTVQPSEAFYWLGESGELNVALRHYAAPAAGLGIETEWLLSLVLEGLPAGSQRLYTLDAQSVRTLQILGPTRQRSASLMGVAVMHAPRGRVLEGRFHANVRQQAFGFLDGWSPDIRSAPVAVMVGEFRAVHDPVRGQAIRLRTEADRFGRDGEVSSAIVVPSPD